LLLERFKTRVQLFPVNSRCRQSQDQHVNQFKAYLHPG
jgi:hypothetical protein